MVPCSLARCWSSCVTLRWRIVRKPPIPQRAEGRRNALSTCTKSLAASPEHLYCSSMSGNVRSTLTLKVKTSNEYTVRKPEMCVTLASTTSILTQTLGNKPRLPTCSLTQASSDPVKTHASQLTRFHVLTVTANLATTLSQTSPNTTHTAAG